MAALRELGRARAGTDPALAAEILSDACAIAGELGSFREALPDCLRAVDLWRGSGAGADPGGEARALNNLGLALQALGRPAEARARFGEALALNRRAGDAEAEAINLGNLGALALETGRYGEALALYRKGAALADRHREALWAAEQGIIARVNQGVALERIGAYREALGIYRAMLADPAGGTGLDPRWRASLLVNAGVVYRNLGDPVAAVDAFRQAVDLYRRLGDQAGLANAHLNLGIAAHLNLARPAEAEAAFREALGLARAGGDRGEEVRSLFYMGRLLLDAGRLDEAEQTYRECLAAARESGSAEGLWSAQEGLGRIAAARGDLAGALRSFEGALSTIERLRAGIAGGPRRAGYFGDKRTVYAAAVDVLARLAHREPAGPWAGRALEVAERAKARDLLDTLGTAGAARRPARPLPAAELRRRTGPGTLLAYFLGERRLYLWTVRREGVRLVDLGPRQAPLEAAARVHAALARGREPRREDLALLSRTLLAPAGGVALAAEPLRIAPDGVLHYLPFELLPDPGRPGSPLVERTGISYLPSASTLPWLEPPEKRGGGPELALAGFAAPTGTDPANPADPANPEIAAADLLAARLRLPALPGAARELAAVARRLGGKSILYTGSRATEGAFRRAVARGARVVHVATHTVVDERRAHGASILLAPGGGDDGLLRPEEIAALDDRAELTVLAACRTALGSGDDGRALSSLTGAFLAAGSPAVIATLWDVGDRETAAFMDQLYFELGRGRPPAEALRQAKLRLLADPRWSRPALWAGYVLVGEGRPVARRRPAGWVMAAAGLALAVGAGWAVAARKARRQRQARQPG